MARTTTEIYNAMLADKGNRSELNVYYSTSLTAVWKLVLWIVAYTVWLHESLWAEYKVDLQNTAKTAIAGTIAWYRSIIFDFQNGDDLVLVGDVYQYELIDEAKKIVKYCAITETEGGIFVKVAKDVDGVPAQITDAADNNAMSNLLAYLTFKKFAGTRLNLYSLVADNLLFDVQVYYNGMLSYSTVHANVVAAIVAYLQSLDFDGAFKRSAFMHAILSVEGVTDVYVEDLQSQYGTQEAVDIDRQTIPASGYWAIDGGNTFATDTQNEDGSTTSSNGGNCSITLYPNV